MALFFGSRKSNNFSFGSLLKTDMHSHILPSIDDGPVDIEGSLLLVEGLMNNGFNQLIATAHIMNDHYLNNSETIRNSLSKLRKALIERDYPIRVEAAAEYMMDDNFENLLDRGELLSFGDHYVLVETFLQHPPANLHEILFNMQIKKYQVVLAHPERYQFVDDKLKYLYSLKEKGACFQVNALSFTGYYGKKERKIAEKMLDAGLIDFIGTNIHHPKHLKALERCNFSSKVIQQLEHHPFLNHSLPLVTN